MKFITTISHSGPQALASLYVHGGVYGVAAGGDIPQVSAFLKKKGRRKIIHEGDIATIVPNGPTPPLIAVDAIARHFETIRARQDELRLRDVALRMTDPEFITPPPPPGIDIDWADPNGILPTPVYEPGAVRTLGTYTPTPGLDL